MYKMLTPNNQDNLNDKNPNVLQPKIKRLCKQVDSKYAILQLLNGHINRFQDYFNRFQDILNKKNNDENKLSFWLDSNLIHATIEYLVYFGGNFPDQTLYKEKEYQPKIEKILKHVKGLIYNNSRNIKNTDDILKNNLLYFTITNTFNQPKYCLQAIKDCIIFCDFVSSKLGLSKYANEKALLALTIGKLFFPEIYDKKEEINKGYYSLYKGFKSKREEKFLKGHRINFEDFCSNIKKDITEKGGKEYFSELKDIF